MRIPVGSGRERGAGAAQPVRDPTVLRGLAHPVRSRIVDEMYATGPVRAADIARDLGIPANQASFHLRQLAKYGLVEEAPGAGRDRRDRVWQLTAQTGLSIDMADLAAVPVDGRPSTCGGSRPARGRTGWSTPPTTASPTTRSPCTSPPRRCG